jgi:hypothetical protein
MKSCLPFVYSVVLMLPMSLGCEPKPIVEEPPAQLPPVIEQPAVEVDVNSNGTQPPTAQSTTPDENAAVEVEVGGGQGVEVDVNQPAPQQ